MLGELVAEYPWTVGVRDDEVADERGGEMRPPPESRLDDEPIMWDGWGA